MLSVWPYSPLVSRIHTVSNVGKNVGEVATKVYFIIDHQDRRSCRIHRGFLCFMFASSVMVKTFVSEHRRSRESTNAPSSREIV